MNISNLVLGGHYNNDDICNVTYLIFPGRFAAVSEGRGQLDDVSAPVQSPR